MARTESTLHWLHLSDFHFDAGQSWDRDRSVKALLEFLAEKKEQEGWRPDFVFATGDFSNRGKREEFDHAIHFFKNLAETLDLNLDRDLFVVPGNHDVDRGAKGPMDDAILEKLAAEDGAAQQEEIAKVLRHPPTMRLLGSRLAEYYSFTERLLGPARRTQDDQPWRTDMREVRGVEVAILQLNSAWASGGVREKGNLLVGAHQIEEGISQAAGARLRFALVHHPADYLADGDAFYFRRLVQARGSAHFLLRGHLHENDLQIRTHPDGGLIELAAGAVYQGTGWPKRFQIGTLDLTLGQGSVELLTYSDKSVVGFWAVDSASYRELRDGRYNFELPRELRLGQEQAKKGAPLKAHQATVAARYCIAVAAVHGQMRFIGFPSAATGNRPNVEVLDLFVPLRLRVGHELQESLTTEELLERLLPSKEPSKEQGERFAQDHDPLSLLPGKEPAERFVVLGEPGSGKTTLCRFAAVFFAGQLAQLGSKPRPLPLFLPFRDYMRRRREAGDCDLIDYLVEQAKNHLQVIGAGRELLEVALVEGQAVLLLDGLDEVGNSQEREEMRDRVNAFCRQYPQLPVLLTSRFAGYDEAPLPKGEFVRLELKPFENMDLHTFVANWYAVQEPNDPRARAQGIADLLAAFKAEPRVRALAGNPLLATLIALVHRTEAKLPGERAKLYELVVRTLLDTWPAMARRQFAEIDSGLQRTFLEDFALAQQEGRSRPDSEVAFVRHDLVASLAGQIARQQGGARPESVRRTAEAWVDYLAAGTGLIVEQQPGVFAFLHLSLLEYLAACALNRREESLEEAVGCLQKDPTWREVLLLAVGLHATDPHLLGRLFTRLAADGGWFFLLLALREEAAFENATRRQILDAAAQELLWLRTEEWSLFEEVVRTLERFSVRHGKATREWRLEKLAHALGDELRGVVGLSLSEPEEIWKLLGARSDRGRAAADLLEFWPGSKVGNWAASEAEAEAAGAFLAEAPAELALPRALASCGPGLHLAAAAAPLQLERAFHFFHTAAVAMGELAGRERPGGQDLPRQVHILKFPLTLEVVPKWPRPACPSALGGLRHFARDFSREFALNFSRAFARDFSRAFAREYAPDFSRAFVLNFSQEFTLNFSRAFALNFSPQFVREIALAFARGFDLVFTRTLALSSARNFALDFNVDFDLKRGVDWKTSVLRNSWKGAGNGQEGPATSSTAEDRRAVAAFLEAPGDKTRDAAGLGTFSRRVAEAWIALATTSEAPREQAGSYLGHRLQNVALLYLWPNLDLFLPVDPPPEQLALYLQLGWTQSTTTQEWPATERWIALLTGIPPDHWMPRAQWHLCWLLHDPESADHQAEFNAALRQGLLDDDLARNAVAQTLEKVIGFYP